MEEKRSRVTPGDIVMAKIGERCGASAILPHSHEVGILSGNALKITVDQSRCSTQFIWQVLWNLHTAGKLEELRTTGAQPALSMASLKKFKIPVPPTLAEQEAIATALSDADAWIESLEQLIAKKRQIKQGAMQELLTGKRRLPGFSGEWVVKLLSSLCNRITTGKLDANAMSDFGKYPFYTCAREHSWIDTFAFDDESLLVSGNGANVGYVHYYSGKFNAYQRTYVLTDFTADIHFLKLYMEVYLSERIRTEVNAGNTPYITMGTLTEMQVVLPSDRREQTAIAAILSDIDTELAMLETKLTKARQIKQGMMQELLTGRIRLV